MEPGRQEGKLRKKEVNFLAVEVEVPSFGARQKRSLPRIVVESPRLFRSDLYWHKLACASLADDYDDHDHDHDGDGDCRGDEYSQFKAPRH